MIVAFLVWIIIPVLAQENPDPFEGVIIYSVEIEYPENYEYGWYIDQKYGDTMLLFVSAEGDYLRKYKNSGNMGWDFTSYSQTENAIEEMILPSKLFALPKDVPLKRWF